MLLQKLDLGATMYHIETGYLQKDEMAVCCVISSRKLHTVTDMVQEVDKKAFLSVTQINEVRGRRLYTGSKIYIRWEMTPAFAGGEQQACISGGIQSPI